MGRLRMPVLAFESVHFRYGDQTAGLADCSLHFEAGSRNALLGANGSGKTTLLLHAAGLLRPEAGRLMLDGVPLDYSRAGLHALRRRVGLVFQNPDNQLFGATIAEDVSFGPLNLGLDAPTVEARVHAALAVVGLSALAGAPVHQLSFGQKKRVCIAGVLAMQPDLLLLDEPMAGLDPAMQAEMQALLERLSAAGVSIVLATHDIDFAYAWADALHVLAAGRCIASFPASALPAHTARLQAAGQPLPGVLRLETALSARGITVPPLRSLDALINHLSPSSGPSNRAAGDGRPQENP